MTMNELFSLYERQCLPKLEPRTQRDYLNILGFLRTTFGHLEHSEVTPRKVMEFLEVATGRIHRNRMVMILSTVFKRAAGKWLIDEQVVNPCTVVEKWPSRPRERYVTDDEFTRFRAICCPTVQIAMDLALLIGQRQGDIIGMRWEQIKATGLPREQWHIEIDQGKTGKKLAIMMSPAVEAVLDRAWLLQPEWPRDFVVRANPRSTPGKGRRYSEDGFRAMWQRYQRQWINAGNAGFHFHDLRAKSISDNKDFDAAYLLAGHISPTITRRVYDRARRVVQPLR